MQIFKNGPGPPFLSHAKFQEWSSCAGVSHRRPCALPCGAHLGPHQSWVRWGIQRSRWDLPVSKIPSQFDHPNPWSVALKFNSSRMDRLFFFFFISIQMMPMAFGLRWAPRVVSNSMRHLHRSTGLLKYYITRRKKMRMLLSMHTVTVPLNAGPLPSQNDYRWQNM